MKACVVIPTYKENPDTYELIGLKRCAQILSNFPVALVVPQELNVNIYKNIFKDNLKVFYFSKKFFKNLHAYNRLMTSTIFYKTFSEFEYILIHHTDAYVFRDELLDWCNKDYHYIGAPIYEFDGTISPKKYLGIGNGGFSLHHVNSALKVLSSWRIIYPLADLKNWYIKYNWKGRIRYLPYFFTRLVGYGRLSHSGFNHLLINEDIFWGIYVPAAFSWFKVAPFDEAFRFSMEYNCEYLYKLNCEQLPFGCHQWYKGDFIKFWQKFIPIS